MIPTSPAAQAIIESGQYLKVEVWQVTIQNYGNPITYYLTAGDAPLTAPTYTAAGFGAPNTYLTGINLVRDRIVRKRGTQPGAMTMACVPQPDYPGGPPLLAGGGFVAQASSGVLDGAIWLLLKGYFAFPGQPPCTSSTGYVYTPPPLGSQLDTSPGVVPYWGAVTGKMQVGRFMADIDLSDITALLVEIQMPRNVIQPSCVWTFCDTGCALNKSQNTFTGTITAVSSNSVTTTLSSSSFADNDFGPDGVLTFSSGALNGVEFRTASSGHVGANVTIQTTLPFPKLPAIGDTFSCLLACNKTLKKCKSGRFVLPGGSSGSNAAHYRGYNFVPNPETLYDGASGNVPIASSGRQGQPGSGSAFTGIR